MTELYYLLLFGFWKIGNNFEWWLLCMKMRSVKPNLLIPYFWEKLNNRD